MRVAYRRDVSSPRPRVQLCQERIVARLLLDLAYTAVRVPNVAKHDGARGTSLLTSSLHIVAGQHCALERLSILIELANALFRSDLRRIDALDAVGAFFHYAARTHAYIRIAHRI